MRGTNVLIVFSEGDSSKRWMLDENSILLFASYWYIKVDFASCRGSCQQGTHEVIIITGKAFLLITSSNKNHVSWSLHKRNITEYGTVKNLGPGSFVPSQSIVGHATLYLRNVQL